MTAGTGADGAAESGASPTKRLVFTSYAWNDASALATRLRRDLEARGFGVWLDVEKMRTPERWSLEIVEAIDHADIVLALLSPQAVRSADSPESLDHQDSVCHYELQHARLRKKPILPVVVLACAAPPLLGAFPLDWSDWGTSEEAYRAGLERLARTIEDLCQGRGRPFSRLVDELEPIDFYLPLARHRKFFSGRDWIFAALGTALGQGGPLVLIEGEAGTGKSALMAELVHRDPDRRVLGHFVLDRGLRVTLEPKAFVRTMAALIASRLPAYRETLESREVNRWLSRERCAADPLGAFVQGIVRPLAELPAPAGGPLILVVDALDEGLSDGAGPGTASASVPGLLAAALKDFPGWLKLVATTRPAGAVGRLFPGGRRIIIDPASPDQRQDLKAYLARRLKTEPGLDAQPDAERLAAIIEERSAGSFLYAQLTLDALRDGAITPTALPRLPPGLAALYDELFRRLFPDPETYRPAAAVLEALLAAREGLSESEIAAATGLEARAELRPVLSGLAGILGRVEHGHRPDREPRLKLHHKSLADWLVNPPAGAADYRLDRSRGQRALVAYARRWAEQGHPYQFVNLVPHLVETGALDEAEAALAGPFAEARAAALGQRAHDLDDMAALAGAWLTKGEEGKVIAAARSANGWARDGISAALNTAGDPALVGRLVEALLAAKAVNPKEPEPAILNLRAVAGRVAATRGLGPALVALAGDPAALVRFQLVPELYRFWRRQGEASWPVLETMGAKGVSGLGLPNPEMIETLGHLSLAMVSAHRAQPEAMARLLGIWRELARRLGGSALFRAFGRRWVIKALTHPLAQLLQRQPDYQPLNLRELAATFALPPARRQDWLRLSACLTDEAATLAPIADLIAIPTRPFDLFLMLAAERVLIVKGVPDAGRALDGIERIYRDGPPWFRQSALYALFHILVRAKGADPSLAERYGALARDFVATGRATMQTSVKLYAFAPHLAWPEIVAETLDPGSGPRFLPETIRQALALEDRELLARAFKAVDLLSFAYGRHGLALGVIDAVRVRDDPRLETPILESLANIRLGDEIAVERFLADRGLSVLARRLAGLTPTLRAADMPTWIDDFVIDMMVSAPWFRREVGAAFARAAAAKDEAEFLHQILVWVIGLMAGEATHAKV